MARDHIAVELTSPQEHPVHTPTNLSIHTAEARVSQQTTNTLDDSKLSHEEITEKAWKYVGYRRYCNFISHINDFLIIRRFGALNVRVLLALQDKVVALEERLNDLDEAYSKKGTQDIHNGRFRGDEDDRTALLWEIHASLNDFYSFAKQFSEFAGRPEPNAGDVKSLRNWLNKYKDCIWHSEQDYLSDEKQNDLFALVPKTRTPLRKLLQKFDSFRLSKYFKLEPPSTLPIYEREGLTCTSHKSMERVTTVIIVSTGIGMLLAPAWILEFLETVRLRNWGSFLLLSLLSLVWFNMLWWSSMVKHWRPRQRRYPFRSSK